jgi:hypothetical protein
VCATFIFNASNSLHAAIFGTAASTRSDWKSRAHLFNSKCNPSTLLALVLPDAMTVLDKAWTDRLKSHQLAGEGLCKMTNARICHLFFGVYV